MVTSTVSEEKIKIKYTCACPSCGAVNIKEDREMSLDDFNALAKNFPREYWKEDCAGVTIGRQHEEDSSARCRHSC
jgi:hypothetical protein